MSMTKPTPAVGQRWSYDGDTWTVKEVRGDRWYVASEKGRSCEWGAGSFMVDTVTYLGSPSPAEPERLTRQCRFADGSGHGWGECKGESEDACRQNYRYGYDGRAREFRYINASGAVARGPETPAEPMQDIPKATDPASVNNRPAWPRIVGTYGPNGCERDWNCWRENAGTFKRAEKPTPWYPSVTEEDLLPDAGSSYRAPR